MHHPAIWASYVIHEAFISILDHDRKIRANTSVEKMRETNYETDMTTKCSERKTEDVEVKKT